MQENTYGRGQRSRNNPASINYRALAGEVPAFDYDLDKDNTEFDYHRYANKHILQVLDRDYDDTSSILQIVSNGQNLTAKNLLSTEHPLTLNRPMLITDTAASIGMKTFQNRSKSKISISEFGKLIGMSHPVTVMDVRNQEELEGWNFGDLVDYFTDEDRLYTTSRHRQPSDPSRVLNQISLEFSHTPLRDKFSSPSFVRELDWIDTVWPRSKRNRGDFPRVQYYCLTSTAGCYTDFHVDFGGTSVHYHVHSGRKTFLLIPPTDTNLTLYEKWLCSKNQNDIFFPDMEHEVLDTNGCACEEEKKDKVGPVLRITIEENQTFIIPSGWIHAVYTPVDSIVVGGNFLHGLDIKLQLDVHCLETRTRVPAKFRFPSFVQLMFYAGVHYYKRMMEPTKYGVLHDQEIAGLWDLIQALKTWSVQPAHAGSVIGSVPNTMRDCVTMVSGINYKINNCKEMCLALESELERIKIGKKRSPKLKISLKRSRRSGDSMGDLLLESNQIDGGNKKLKLKLRLGTLPRDKRKVIADNLQTFAPVTVPTSIGTLKRQQSKISDLASKHNIHQVMDDDEWKPGSSIVPNCTRKVSHKSDSSIKMKKTVETTPQTIHLSCSIEQKNCQMNKEGKKNMITLKKRTGGVKERLKKKFGR